MIPGQSGATMTRVITGVILAAITLALIWTPDLHMAWTGFALLIAGVGLYEYFNIVRAKGIDAEGPGGIVLGLAVVLSAYYGQIEVMSATLTGAIAAISALHLFRRKHTAAGFGASILGIAYVAWFAAHAVALHALPVTGSGLVTALLVAVVLSDTGAYFAGRAFGRHKLAPKISPNKTWEGSIGGVAAAMAGMAILFGMRSAFGGTALPAWPLTVYLLTGAILALVSQIGDLIESMLKRDAGVKDSGGIFPGHGGVLDRCDGILFAAPVLYYVDLLLTR